MKDESYKNNVRLMKDKIKQSKNFDNGVAFIDNYINQK
jgi:hypothetical protein